MTSKEDIKECFHAIDEDGSGKLDYDEIIEFIKSIELDETLVGYIWLICDGDENDGVTLKNFMKKFDIIGNFDKDRDAVYKEAFKKLDKKGKGEITKKEVKKFLNMMGGEVDKDDVKEVLEAMDQDGDGAVDYDEFREFLQSLE